MDIHILGYYMDYHAPSFQKQLFEFIDSRRVRNEAMCRRIHEYTGFPITADVLARRWPDAVITRAHMAAWLTEQGYVESRKAAFDQYIGDHAPCFVPKQQVTPQDAIRLLLDHGGIPVLAHPLLYALSKGQLNALTRELAEAGLRGIEAIYVMNKGSDEAHMRSLAQTYGLLLTGGSDFHGENKPRIALGTGLNHNLEIPCHLLEDLKAARERIAGGADSSVSLINSCQES